MLVGTPQCTGRPPQRLLGPPVSAVLLRSPGLEGSTPGVWAGGEQAAVDGADGAPEC